MTNRGQSSPDLKKLLAEILVDAVEEDEQLWAFRQRFEERLRYPLHGFMLGEPVLVTRIDYDGNPRRGLTATCRKLNDEQYMVGLVDLELLEGSDAARYLAAYRKWLGVDSAPNPRATRGALRQGKTVGEAVPSLANLIVLSVKERAARCRFAGKTRAVTFQTRNHWRLVPGEVLSVQIRQMWHDGGQLHLSGYIVQNRIDVAVLGLRPPRLRKLALWDPAQEEWAKGKKPWPEWVRAIAQAGPRPIYEMEQISPARERGGGDVIGRSVELKEAGHLAAAKRILMNLAERDLACLDAHAHLGNLEFEASPGNALRHYEVGRRIGELAFPEEFKGLLPWAWPKNRPYLRCLHGYGLSLWKLGRPEEARRTFERMLWLNPNDNQGARFLLQDIRHGRRWAACGTSESHRISEPALSSAHDGRNVVVATGSVDRAATLAEQMRLADDLDRKWRVDDLLAVLQPARMTRNALAYCWKFDQVEEVSLRGFMDLVIVEEADPRPGYLITRLLDLRCIGIKGFWSVVNRLTALDLGARCNAEGHRRLVRLKGCWRVRGVRQTWSKPCAPQATARMDR